MIKYALWAALFCFVPLTAELRHKESVTLEYGKKYDSNIVLPDTVTRARALVTEFAARPAMLLQFNPRTMLRITLALQSEESDLFPVCNIRKVRSDLQFKHLFSHLTMAGARVSYDRNGSDYSFYDYERMEASVEAGRYLSPTANLEASLGGRQMVYPGLYRTSLSDMLKKSYYYDWREAVLSAVLKQAKGGRISWSLNASGALRDYFHDDHDSDYVGYENVPQDTVLNIIPGGYDTVYSNYRALPLYAANVRQQDIIGELTLSMAVKLEEVTFLPKMAIRASGSNDDYYSSLYLSPSIRVVWAPGAPSFTAIYAYDWEYYPDRRYENGDREQEKGHYTGLEYGQRLSEGLSLTLAWYYRYFDSTFNPDDFSKKMISAFLVYSR